MPFGYWDVKQKTKRGKPYVIVHPITHTQQAIAVQRELGVPLEKFNVDGGAIAVGHPLGASGMWRRTVFECAHTRTHAGARITAHLVYALQQRNVKHAIGSACIGGGQGISVVLEAI